MTFTAAATLDLPDELAVGATPAALYHLDPITGEWETIAATVTAAGGRLTAAMSVASGGLYAFGVEVPATTVTGRVIDTEGNAVPEVMVRIDHVSTSTDGGGAFAVANVPAVRGDGSARQATWTLFAGGTWLPVQASSLAAVTTAPVDLGDLTLDTVPAGNIRVQQVVRARADRLRPARVSSVETDVALVTTSDINGQVFFEDVPADLFGFQEARPFVGNEVLYGQSVAALQRGRRWLDSFQFLFERTWFIGTRRTRAYVCDAVGGGPIEGAELVQGAQPGEGRIGTTTETGTFFVVREFDTRATATNRSERDGRAIVHALSIVRPDADHLEFPMRRQLRQPIGTFDRHGVVSGTLIGVDPTREHAIRTTRNIARQEWWDEIVFGEPIRSSLPIDIDPADTHAEFRVGVAATGGSVAATEFSRPGGQKTLHKVGLLEEFVPVEGEVSRQDLSLDAEATAAFVLPGATVGADPAIDLANLTVALGLAQGDDRVADIARDLQGNIVVTGADLTLALPSLDGALAERSWLAVVSGERASAGVTSSHASLVTLSSSTFPDFSFPEFPELTGPAPGAALAAEGFVATFTLPPSCLFGTLELRSQTNADLLLWQIVLRRTETGFAFVALPGEAATPLLPGRSYTLTLSAWFGDVSTGSPDPQRDVVAFAQSIGPIEAGLTQVASQSIQITTL